MKSISKVTAESADFSFEQKGYPALDYRNINSHKSTKKNCMAYSDSLKLKGLSMDDITNTGTTD